MASMRLIPETWPNRDLYCARKCINKETGFYNYFHRSQLYKVVEPERSYDICAECLEKEKERYHRCCLCDMSISKDYVKFYTHRDGNMFCSVCLTLNTSTCSIRLGKLIVAFDIDTLKTDSEFNTYAQLLSQKAKFLKEFRKDVRKTNALKVIMFHFNGLSKTECCLLVDSLSDRSLEQINRHYPSGVSKMMLLYAIANLDYEEEMAKHPYARF